MENNLNYSTLSKEDLIQTCVDKDIIIDQFIKSQEDSGSRILNKKDIMNIYSCESDKALKILKLMFQMGYGNKIGKEYYISKESQSNFIKDMAGREVLIWCFEMFRNAITITFYYHFLETIVKNQANTGYNLLVM